MALIQYVAKLAVDKDTGLPLPELQGQGGTIIKRGQPSSIPTIYEDKDGNLAIPGSAITVNSDGFTSSFWVDEADLPISWRNGATEVPLESVEGVAIRLDDLEVLLADTADAATAALSTATRADDVGYDVVALLGQSNMIGRGEYVSQPPTNPRVFALPARNADANKIVQAVDPLSHWSDLRPGTVGMGTTFANDYLNTVSQNRKVLLVPAAQGATGFISGVKRWRTTHTPEHENLYLKAVRQIRLALEAAGPNARLVGVLWHQGEADSAYSNMDYVEDLQAVINGIRDEFSVPDMWAILGQMQPAGIAISSGKQMINEVHINFPASEYRTAFAYAPHGLHREGDTTHFNGPGIRALGHSYARALPLAQANVPGEPALPPTRVYSVNGRPGALNVEWERPWCRFTDFVVQHRPAGSTQWLTWAHDPTLHNQAEVLGYAAGASVEVRVATVNEQGTSAFTEPVTLTPTPYAVETVPNAPARAFSFRKIVRDYAGNACRVRRSSDGAEQDIGFTPEGLLDEDALRDFCGSADGYVTRWFDQTDNTLAWRQTTDSAQPQIVDGGAVIKVSGRPALRFDGVDDYLYTADTAGCTVNGMSASFVTDMVAHEGVPRFFSEGDSSTTTPMYGWYTDDEGLLSTSWRDDSGSARATKIEDALLLSGNQILVVTDTLAEIRGRANDYVSDPVARESLGATDASHQALGALLRTSATNFALAMFSEVVLWYTPLSPDTFDALTDNQKDHYTLGRTDFPAG